jgi:hypothetical protein
VTFLKDQGTVYPSKARDGYSSRFGPETEEYKYMLKVKVLSLAAALLSTLAVNAQPAAQDWEVTLGGGGQFQSDFKGSSRSGPGGSLGAQLGLGYYLNDNMEVAVRQALNYVSNGTWAGATRAAIDYNFLMDKFVPFVGAELGYAYGNKGINDSWGFGPEAGVKYYIQSKAFIFGMAEYQMPFHGKTFKEGTWNLTLGIGLNL